MGWKEDTSAGGWQLEGKDSTSERVWIYWFPKCSRAGTRSIPTCNAVGLKVGSDALGNAGRGSGAGMEDAGLADGPPRPMCPPKGWVWGVGVQGCGVALGEAALRREGVWCPLLGQAFKSTLALRINKQLNHSFCLRRDMLFIRAAASCVLEVLAVP